LECSVPSARRAASFDAEAISIEGQTCWPARPHHRPLSRIVDYLSADTLEKVAAGIERPPVGDSVVALNAAGSHAETRGGPGG